MRSSVTVKQNTEKCASCNCCEDKEDNVPLWDVSFAQGGYSQLVKLCESHISELRSALNTTFDTPKEKEPQLNVYRVKYRTSSDTKTTSIVLAEDKTKIYKAVAKKDSDFKLGITGIYCIEEVPLSNVLVSELSVAEFNYLTRGGLL